MTSEVAEIGTKRGNGFDEYADTRPYKQSRTGGRMTTRMLLVGRYCGAIVGKGGEIVKKLREKHHVQISGLNRHTSQRVLSLVGERDNIIGALKEILPVAALEAPHPASQQKCNFEINLLVHSGHIGAVIGKGGSKIREITEVSEGKIQIHQECLPKSNERVVAVGGESVERIIDALDIIFDTVEGLPKKEDDMLYDPEEGGIVEPSSGGGGGGGNRQPLNRSSSATGKRLQDFQMPNTNNQIGLALGGNQLVNSNQLAAAYQLGGAATQQLALNNSLGPLGGLNMGAQSLIGQLSVGNQGAGGLGGLGNLAAGGVMGLGRQGLGVGSVQGATGFGAQAQLNAGLNRGQLGNQMNNQLMNQRADQGYNTNAGNFPQDNGTQLDFLQIQTKTELTVNPEMCGAIIGKGGKSIKDVRASTGVKIVLTGNEKGSKEDRVITITGTQQQVQTAEQMLTEFVRNYRK